MIVFKIDIEMAVLLNYSCLISVKNENGAWKPNIKDIEECCDSGIYTTQLQKRKDFEKYYPEVIKKLRVSEAVAKKKREKSLKDAADIRRKLREKM